MGYGESLFSRVSEYNHLDPFATGTTIGAIFYVGFLEASYLVRTWKNEDRTDDIDIHVKRESIKRAWREAQTQYSETMVYVQPKGNEQSKQQF